MAIPDHRNGVAIECDHLVKGSIEPQALFQHHLPPTFFKRQSSKRNWNLAAWPGIKVIFAATSEARDDAIPPTRRRCRSVEISGQGRNPVHEAPQSRFDHGFAL